MITEDYVSFEVAKLLKEKGFDVIGYYFDITGCNAEGKAEAQAVADQVGITLLTEDVKPLFEEVVIENFCSEYMAGRTPNPCIVCNPGVKFRRLLDKADEIGAYYIATGHYARIFCDELQEKYFRILKDGYLSMDMAQNILVIKTVSGMAMAVAAAIDHMRWHEVAGCIAGDDTIMCAVRTVDDTVVVMEKIRKIVV
jgi:hypothetical protein